MNVVHMRLGLNVSACLVMLGFLLSNHSFAQETGLTLMEREVSYLSEIWPGNYDNQEQISLDARATEIEEAQLPRFHTEVKRLSISSLGDHVFYVEKRRDDDKSKVHSKHVYAASADDDSNAIRLTAYQIKPSAINRDLSKLRKQQLNLMPGCDISLQRDGDAFVGQTVARQTSVAGAGTSTCGESSESSDYIERFVRISATQYSFNDRRVSPTGEYKADFKVRNMERARWFACMIDVPKEVEGVSNHTQHYIKLHDQGGRFKFIHPDGRELVLLMRNTWSYGMQRETFFIGVFEDNVKGKLLVYSWGQPGSDRIGLNPGYVRVQCDLDTPKNVKLQKELRADS